MLLCSIGKIGQAEKWINIEKGEERKKKGLCVFIVQHSTLHPMCKLVVSVAGLTQAKKRNPDDPL